jgi:hypothetical protein
MVTENSADPVWVRNRLVQIDQPGVGPSKTIAPPVDNKQQEPQQQQQLPPIVVRASAPGFADAIVQISTSVDAATDSPLAVAVQMAGKPVSFD